MRAFLIVATSLVSLLAQSAPRVTTVRLYVFDCGVLVRGEPTAYGLTKEQVSDTNFADACYLVAHPKGTLLWDVGIIPDAQITPGGVSIAVGTSGNSNRATRTLRSQLAEIGYRPDDITFLALSHSHGDHIANANDYAQSTWLVQKPERDLMFSEQAQKGATFACAVVSEWVASSTTTTSRQREYCPSECGRDGGSGSILHGHERVRDGVQAAGRREVG
jgi:glyoxylase-like metal-dependent hydrolase (beta-lactamase superfamily II)